MLSPNKRTFLTYKRHKLNSQVNRTPSINNITLPPPQVNRLTKRNSELEASVSGLEQQSKEMSNQKRDIEQADRDKSGKVRELEKQLKQTRLEKDDFSRDLTDAQGWRFIQSKILIQAHPK